MKHTTAISALKKSYGSRLTILAHHYESDAVIQHSDIVGDSLELARKINTLDAEHIVFCGVHFMAETAAILARPGQKVHIPDPCAGCVMANMVPPLLAEQVLHRLMTSGLRILPLTYVNSPAAVKAVCGQHGGSVCTSANAKTMLTWGLQQADAVLFLPDANLGQNTARLLGLDTSSLQRLRITGQGNAVLPATPDKRLYLWPGLCAVHAKIRTEHVLWARQHSPRAQILVHPECAPDVVELADGAGSTSFLIQQVHNAPSGATIYVGTEWNLVHRLALRYPDKTILPLRDIRCSNMAKTTEANLLTLLENLDSALPVTVDQNIAQHAQKALTRMLEACARPQGVTP